MSMRRLPLVYKSKVILERGAAAAGATATTETTVRSATSDSPATTKKAVLQLIRFDPSNNTKRIDSYEFIKNQDFMVLDLLTAVKAHQDPSLAFRASCCEGVCGSCGMNINGINSLACVTFAQQVTTVGPLPNFPVLKDMVVDLRGFFKQYEYIRPFTRNVNLGRHHASSILARYKNACKVLYGSSTAPTALAASTSDRAVGVNPLQLYYILLDQVVKVGDVSKVVDLLQKIKSAGYKMDNSQVKSIIQEALKNKKA